MARWMMACMFALGVVTIGVRDTYRATDAQSLGGLCESTHACQDGMRCVDAEGVMEGQCSSSCSDTSACTAQFGQAVLCLGADLCARACAEASDCPQGTRCNVYGWCERSHID